jgi:hypothetical protein
MGPQAASAQLNGTTQSGEGLCMQKAFGTPVTPSNRINCTANDIRISGATNVSPSSCILGTHFTLTGTFTTVVTANARYDASFFFRIDGGDNARGTGVNATGICSLSRLTNGVNPALDLDGDTCGDLNSGTYELTFEIENVLCSDPDENGFLNLPNCTSWHNSAGIVCDTNGPLAGSAPETKSKCVCDDTFEVPVIVASPDGTVTKVATQAEVTYKVTVVSTAQVDETITALTDSIYGNITLPPGPAPAGNPNITATTCTDAVGTVLTVGDGQPNATKGGDTYICEFKAKYLSPGTVGNVENTVTATLDTDLGDPVQRSGKTKINIQLNITP